MRTENPTLFLHHVILSSFGFLRFDEIYEHPNRIGDELFSLRTVSLLNFYEHSKEIAKVISSVNCQCFSCCLFFGLFYWFKFLFSDVFMCSCAKFRSVVARHRCRCRLSKSDYMKANLNMSRAFFSLLSLKRHCSEI